MLTEIFCDNCNKSGRLPFNISLDVRNPKSEECRHCGHEDFPYISQTFYFCCYKCLVQFVKEKTFIILENNIEPFTVFNTITEEVFLATKEVFYEKMMLKLT